MREMIALAEPVAGTQAGIRARIERELRGNILPFWSAHVVDHSKGGFYGALSNSLYLRDDQPRSAVLCARVLWTYAEAYRLYRHAGYLATARHALGALGRYFWDARNGGVHWMLDPFNRPLSTRKHTYAQAFAIYGLAAFHRATGDAASLRMARTLFQLLERHAHEPRHGGYIEGCAGDWGALADMRLSDKEPNCRKSMNTLLHMLEAYTALLGVWEHPRLRRRLAELVRIFLDHVIDHETASFRLFFDDAWNTLPAPRSYGHDIEGSWLLVRAAEALGDAPLLARMQAVAVAMAQSVYAAGRAPDGSVRYEDADADRHWWVQAEALVGFYNAYQLSGWAHFRAAAEDVWAYIESNFVDARHGEWFKILDPLGRPRHTHPKTGPWECPYHHSRACYELLERMR